MKGTPAVCPDGRHADALDDANASERTAVVFCDTHAAVAPRGAGYCPAQVRRQECGGSHPIPVRVTLGMDRVCVMTIAPSVDSLLDDDGRGRVLNIDSESALPIGRLIELCGTSV